MVDSRLVEPSKIEGSPVDKRIVRTQFSDQILKRVIGPERANQALHSISLGVIPVNAYQSAFNINCKSTHH